MFSNPSIPLPKSKKLKQTLVTLIENENKLVRAWAYSALVQLADLHPKLQPKVITILDQAYEDEAASVRARARQIQKNYPWTRKTK